MGEKAGTQIEDLMNDINGNKLSSEENSMVDSIINDLNTGKPKQAVPSQQKMPQLTDEEKQMLMKQQEHEQRMMMEHQMRQQQHMHEQRLMAERQHQEQQELIEEKKKEQELKENPIEKIKEMLYYAKDAIVVLVLTVMFSLEPINEVMKFKSVPFFYNIETDKEEVTGILLKAFIIASIFFVLQYFAK
jgi:hypothetical protein|tara:strand:- start:470 stop:1036 length:567 start_codon:yes stop_codon:yes gene_type:complete